MKYVFRYDKFDPNPQRITVTGVIPGDDPYNTFKIRVIDTDHVNVLDRGGDDGLWTLKVYFKDGSTLVGKFLVRVLDLLAIDNYEELFDGRFNVPEQETVK